MKEDNGEEITSKFWERIILLTRILEPTKSEVKDIFRYVGTEKFTSFKLYRKKELICIVMRLPLIKPNDVKS